MKKEQREALRFNEALRVSNEAELVQRLLYDLVMCKYYNIQTKYKYTIQNNICLNFPFKNIPDLILEQRKCL